MELSSVIMYTGFILAAYSVIGNDVIQTLGTFLSSNENKPWYVLWAFAGSILAAVLIWGWYENGGDVSYSRLIGDANKMCGDPKAPCSIDNPKYPFVENMGWPYLLPPLVLLIVTRLGIPVSTSFLILTFFLPKGLYDMVAKSMMGYVVAFMTAAILYLIIIKQLERHFCNSEIKDGEKKWWTIAQWSSTAFLWTQWLIQDFANIYVYLPRQIDFTTLLFTLTILLAFLAYIFYSKGGAIQQIVKSKTNTIDIRSATFIDLLFGIVLLFFKELNNIPMSTTWVFIGLLAGREIAVRYILNKKVENATLRNVGMDIAKVFLGLVISIALVYFMTWVSGNNSF